MMRRILSVAAVSLILSAGTVQAAIVATFSNSAAFLLAVPVPNANTVTFGPSGPGPFINLNGFATNASAGLLTVAASSGGLFGDSTVLTTDLALDTLILTFSQPVLDLGLSGFITDEFLAAVSGELLIDAVGSGTTTLAVTGAGAAFLGFRSDVAFSSLRISIDSFDQNATASAFVGLTNTMYIGAAPVAVPAPGAMALLVPAIALLLSRRGRRAGAN